MNEGCVIVKCLRCGSTARLMMHSVRSEYFICPVCLEGEVEYRVVKPDIKHQDDTCDSLDILYPYTADPVGVSVN